MKEPDEPAMPLLLTTPGIDALAAAKLPLEIGDDMNTFARAGKLAKWAGICTGNGQSASKRKCGKTTKGNRFEKFGYLPQTPILVFLYAGFGYQPWANRRRYR